MASPQLENGYTKISNELFDALCKTRISGEARQVLDTIIRKTYGFNKTSDQISLSQFTSITNLKKSTICKAINKLISMNIVTKKGNAFSLFTKKGNDTITTYCIQKDYNKWQALPKKVTLPKKETYVTKKGNLTLPKKGHTKDNITKDNITKEIYIDFSFFENSWNELAVVNNIHKITKERKEKIRARIDKNKDFNNSWIKCLETIKNTPFLQGDNDRGWKADFDWLIKNDTNYIKVLEGKYTTKQKNNTNPFGQEEVFL